jgi:HEAT repeat protein
MLPDNRLFRAVTTLSAGLLLTLLALTPALAGDMSTEELATRLVSKDQKVRIEATAELDKRGQPAMMDFLTVLKSGPVNARRGAVIGLAFLPVPGLATDGLIQALNDNDVIVRSLAAHALGKLGSVTAKDVARHLGDKNERIRIGAALALTRMRGEAVPALVTQLGSTEIQTKAKAAWLLGRIGDPARPAVPALIRALAVKDERVMHVIAEAIDLIGADPSMMLQHLTLIGADLHRCPKQQVGENAAPTLVALLARPGTPLTHAAFIGLGQMGQLAKPALLKAFKTGNGSQRTAAALLLSDLDPSIAHQIPEDLRKTLAGAKRQPAHTEE